MEDQDSDDEFHSSKRIKFSLMADEENINFAPEDIFNERQYIETTTPVFDKQMNRGSELWLHVDRLEQYLLKLHKTETHGSRLYKLPIFSKEDHTETLLYLLNRLLSRIDDNLETSKNVALDDVRTLTPLDLSYTEPQEDVVSNDEEIDVVGLSDDEMFECATDENISPNRSNVHSSTSISSNSATSNKNGQKVKKKFTLKVINRKLWKNVELDENYIIHLVPNSRAIYSDTGTKRQLLMKEIIEKSIHLLKTNTYATKRDLFYLFQSYCKTTIKKKKPTQNINDTQQATQRTTQQDTQYLTQHDTQSITQPTTQTQYINHSPNVVNLLETPPQSASQRNDTQQVESQMIGAQQVESPVQDKYNQGILDEIIDDICCLIGCSKINLNILAQSKCIVYGRLNFELDTGETYDCFQKSEGIYIPNPRDSIVKIESSAKFILVIEKDAILQRLISNKFPDEHNAILITSKGYPDWNSRAFLRYLWLRLKLPTFILTDSDPHGIEIACVYRFGSLNLAFDNSRLALPHIKWLGLLPSDTTSNADITSKEKLPLTNGDRNKLRKFFSRPYIVKNREWADQIRTMRDLDYKVEIEGLDDKDDGNKLVKYLLNKIRFGSWI